MGSPLENRFADAAEQAAAHLLVRFPEAKEITVTGFPRGWEIQLDIAGRSVSTEVLLPPEFPSVLPKIRVKPIDEFRFVLPHVEKDGALCLISGADTIPQSAPVQALNCAIERAIQVLESPDPSEFEREFLSYWKTNPNDAWSTNLGDSLPKNFFALCYANQWILAASEAELHTWLKRSGRRRHAALAVERLERIDFPEKLPPKNFPKTVGDLIDLVEPFAPMLAQAIRDHVAWKTGEMLIPFRIPMRTGHRDAVISVNGDSVGMLSKVSKGFRLGHVPWTLIKSRASKETVCAPIQRMGIQSVHHQHIRNRGGNGLDFSGKRVVVVGCGSLGGYVAHMLARMGVGQLLLIDGETLSWDNAGRHILGGFQAGKGKAQALSESLQVEAPHVRVVWQPCPVELMLRERPSELKGADLIVSTTGNWAGDYALNYWARRTEGAPPIIFSWLEPHSVAGHALLVHQNDGGCLGCGCTPNGYFKKSVLPEGIVRLIQGQGCADFYQPYGVVEMMPVASMIAKLAADTLLAKCMASELRTHLGAKDLFDAHELKPQSPWDDRLHHAPHGSYHAGTWSVAHDCLIGR